MVWELVLAEVALGAPGKAASGFAGGRAYGLDDRRSTRVAVGYVVAMSVLGTVLMRYSGPFERAVVSRGG